MTRLPATLKPEDVVAIVDSRERLPLDLHPLAVVTGTLQTGDYTVRGLEHEIAIERKGLGDLLSCVGRHRERFEREIMRLLAYPCRAIVVESTWAEIEAGVWRGKVTPAAAVGSCLGWAARGLPVLMAGDHTRAGRMVSRILFISARRRWRELRSLAGGGAGRPSLVAQNELVKSLPQNEEVIGETQVEKSWGRPEKLGQTDPIKSVPPSGK